MWPESIFMMASVSPGHSPVIYELVLPFWPSPTFCFSSLPQHWIKSFCSFERETVFRSRDLHLRKSVVALMSLSSCPLDRQTYRHLYTHQYLLIYHLFICLSSTYISICISLNLSIQLFISPINLSIHLFIFSSIHPTYTHLSICVPTYPSLHPSIHPCVICLSICLFTCGSIHPSASHQSIHVYVYLSICPSVYHLSIYVSTCPSIHLFINSSIHPYTHYSSTYSTIYPPTHLSMYLCIHPLTYSLIHLFIHPPIIQPHIHLSIHPSICSSMYPFIHPSTHLHWKLWVSSRAVWAVWHPSRKQELGILVAKRVASALLSSLWTCHRDFAILGHAWKAHMVVQSLAGAQGPSLGSEE